MPRLIAETATRVRVADSLFADLADRMGTAYAFSNVVAPDGAIFGGSTLSLIERVQLRADGNLIRGDATVTPQQLDRLLRFAEAWVDSLEAPPPSLAPPARPRAPRPAASP